MPSGGYSGSTVNTLPGSTGAPNQAAFNAGAASALVIAANTKRTRLVIFNDDPANYMYLGVGIAATTATGLEVPPLSYQTIYAPAAVNVIQGAGPAAGRYYEEETP